MRTRRHLPVRPAPRSAFSGYRFPPEVITLAVRWYLRFALSYRDVEELLAERPTLDSMRLAEWSEPDDLGVGTLPSDAVPPADPD